MEEFTFGTLATDELKLVHHRTARRGLQHSHDLTPADPLPGQPVTITARLGPDLAADYVTCYYTLDGSEPVGARGLAVNGYALPLEKVGVAWDTLVWGYVETWRGELPAQPDGVTVRYRIGAWQTTVGAGLAPAQLAPAPMEIFADWPEVQLAAEQAAAAFFAGQPLPAGVAGGPARGHTFAYHVDAFAPPRWAREAVIYQVFVDRFYPGDGRAWLQTEDLSGFCGGTLWGVRDKLDYIADLGADCIWLSPIFVSPSHHGYDATDLRHVEPRLGGEAALHALVDAAHRRGIRILLDYACNHISDEHPIFRSACADPASPYRAWFIFDDSPVGYRTFFGVPSMPQLNHAYPPARDWLIDIARYWIREFDVDGYRLDYANGPGPDFWTDFWTACKGAKPDSFCFGEVIDAPDVQRRYVGRLDGCLDFHTGDMLRRTYALGARAEADLECFLARHAAFFPPGFLMPTFVDNHDMDRFLFIAGGDKDALRRAAAVQMRLPGPPIIYQGTEIGLQQRVSKEAGLGLEVNRVPMAWGADQDRELLAFYQELIRERKRGASQYGLA